VTNAFLRLRSYGLSPEFYSDAQRILRSFAPHLEQVGVSFSAMLGALHFSLSEPKEIVISGRRGDPETEALLKEVRSEFHPNIVVAFVENGESPETEKIIPLASGRLMVNERATAYVCQNQTCQLPVHSIKELRKLLN
jgi:uncharacterized protein YyaL (SSP411 family)